MLLRNVSPIGGLFVPLIGREVEAGAEFEVTAVHARRLLVQDIFEPADDAAKVIAFDLAAEAEPTTVDAEPVSPVDVPLPEQTFDDGWTEADDSVSVPEAAAPKRRRNTPPQLVSDPEGGATE